MGYGDALIAAGQAATLFARSPSDGPIAIRSAEGKLRWHPLWAGNPAVACEADLPRLDTLRSLVTGGGCLPYLDYTRMAALPPADPRWIFTPTWRVRDHRPQLYFTPAELARGDAIARRYPDAVLLEPPPAYGGNQNRHWPRDRWQLLAWRLRKDGHRLVQLAHPAATKLAGVELIDQVDFRDACAILRGVMHAVLPEGGLAHAAAAVGTDTTVLWGGCVSVWSLGYPEHANIFDAGERSPCGTRAGVCPHCQDVWQSISVDYVVKSFRAKHYITRALTGTYGAH